MLSFQNITKIYNSWRGETTALNDVSFEISEGEFVCVVGKSGAGKTTLVKLLTLEEMPTKGNISFKGVDVLGITAADFQKIRRKIGVIYQDYKLLVYKTVAENLSYIMQVIGVSDKSIERDIPRVLELVGLEEKAENFPEELSGGEKQRLAIARALIHRPEIIVADEPTGNLDLYNTYEIVNLLKKVHELGSTVLLLTHDKEVISCLKKRVITLEKGKIVNDDPKGKFIL